MCPPSLVSKSPSQVVSAALLRASCSSFNSSGVSLTMGDDYTGPCSCLLNCVRSWRERDRLRRHTEFLRQGKQLFRCPL